LPAQFFAAVVGQTVLPLTLACFLGAAGFVIDAPQCSFGFDGHYKSSGGLMATKQ